jgi:hypothetical protein
MRLISSQFVTEKVLQAIEAHFPDLRADHIQRRFPPWDAIDPEHPEHAF